MRKEGILIGLALLLFVQFVSAEILISQPSGMYNYGDQLNVSVTVIPKSNANDFFTASVICGDSTIEVYRSALGTSYGTNRVIPVEIVFDRTIVGDLNGVCNVKAEYGPDSATSQSFEITDNVKVSFVSDSALVEPGKAVGITGQAVKSNGKDLNGFVDILLQGTDVIAHEIVKDGKFGSKFLIPSNTAAGNYILTANAYEKPNNEITNTGNASSIVKVKSVVSGADIALSAQDLIPGEILTYSVVLYDQTNQPIQSQEMSVELYGNEKNLIFKKLIKSGESSTLAITSNFTPGNWVLDAKGAGLETTRSFGVNELQNASYEVVNGTLFITNTGNVPYNKPIQVSIGGESDVKDISLDVGEIREFRLLAPDGEYPIEIVQGDNTYTLGTSFLTGNAIAVQDVQGLFTSSKYSAGIWLAIIIILIFIAMKYYKKIREINGPKIFNSPSEKYGLPRERQKTNDKSNGVNSGDPVPLVKNVLDMPRNRERMERREFNRKVERKEFERPRYNQERRENEVIRMEKEQEREEMPVQRKISAYNPPAMVMRKTGPGVEHGLREEAALVAVKIRNMPEIQDSDSNAKESVIKVDRIFDESGAKIIRDRNSILAIFSTHRFAEQAYAKAIELAKTVESVLLDHNRRYVHKVAFGVSLHSGELITEHIGNDFKYTSVGNAIPLTKGLAERAQSEVAVSEAAVTKVRSFVKLQRVQNDNYWKVLGAIEGRDGKYNEFIGQFMKRQKGGW
jgi:hypothetical protein